MRTNTRGSAAATTTAPAIATVFDHTRATAMLHTGKYGECVAVCRAGVATGDPKAQYLLSRCYYSGVGGVDKDKAEAVRLARLSAAQNEPFGLNQLGYYHQHGAGGLTADAVKAVELYRQAAAYGCADAQVNLAYVFEQGTGVATDTAESKRLDKLAADQGHGAALQNMGVETDAASEKMRWYFKAATAPEHQITSHDREDSLTACAGAAHSITGGGDDDDDDADYPAFVAGIQAGVDDAVQDTTREYSHAAHLAASLDQLRNEDHDASSPAHHDVTLQAGNHTITCHRLILMAASVEGEFEDSKADVVHLNECELAMAKRLVAYIYTGKATFTCVEDAAAVLEKAQFYQVDTLVATCTHYLLPRVGAYNSLLVEAVAQGPLCEPLVEAAQQCTATNLDLASTSGVFLGRSAATVTDLLSKEAVHAGSEDAVLGAVLRWVGHDEQARGQHLQALLGHVNLDTVSCPRLSQAMGDQIIRSNAAAVLMLADDLRSAVSGMERPAKRARAT